MLSASSRRPAERPAGTSPCLDPKVPKPTARKRKAIDVATTAAKLVGNIEKVILGKKQQITLALVAYLCEGHILLEDVPGVAKTMLARAFAQQRRLFIQAPAMYAGSAAHRRDRRVDLQSEDD